MKYESIFDAIGNTSFVRLRRVVVPTHVEVWVKLEAHNSGGGAKDRPARSMIEDAERCGVFLFGAMIVESMGGNMGIGLVLVVVVKGYWCVFVCPCGMSVEKIVFMRAFGVGVIGVWPDVDP